MNKLTLDDVRKALCSLEDFGVEALSDEDLLNADFRYDFDLDSMDVTEMTMLIEKQLDICIPDWALEHYDRYGNTVESLLKVYNEALQ